MDKLRLLRKQDDRFWTATSPQKLGEITWHGTKLGKPDWRPTSHQLAYTLDHESGQGSIHVMLNGENKNLEFQVPEAGSGLCWRMIVNTAADSPADFIRPDTALPLRNKLVKLAPRSMVVLLKNEEI